ncbi:DHA2 family efflux MFS transporter permease subunit [Curtobacterium sp. MCPF17_002]|uniref:DHA2 family efflux MFS transporter permease subunit n=1 Tax=Curtobacterium sp. MCPF17_002 TaxID=2175645 RepID=UPI000DA79EF3|nr:DHA2 family efflux MFS transporter permease subunit [Curtobacterium sp. MCPF17_002]WIB78284.1 DHA2 family efflux MFS transporter permease subunit [Curtobacterium sp. MCPF17_002]
MPSRGTTLAVAILASFVAFLDGSVVNVALPAIADELGGQVRTQQWVLDAYLLALGALILLTGSLADTFGRIRVLRVGLGLFGLASIACAVAPTAGLLIAARVAQGVGAALLVPSSLALITAAFPTATRGRAIGTWTAWTSTAFVVGPLLGGVLVDLVGWRSVFAVNVIPIAVTVALLGRSRDRARVVGAPRIDVLGAVLVAVGLAAAAFGLIEQQESGWASPVVLVSLASGAIALTAFLAWERRAPEPLLPLTLFRIGDFRNGNLATAAIYGGVSLGLLVVVLFLQEVAGYPATLAGLATLPIALTSLLLARSIGALAGRLGSRVFVAVGCTISAGGFLLMLTARPPVDFAWQLLPGLLVYGVGLATTVAPLTTAVLASVPSDRAGVASAVNNAVARIAGLVAIAFLSTVVGPEIDTVGFHRALVVTACLFVCGALVAGFGLGGRTVGTASIPAAAAANCNDRAVPAGVGAGRPSAAGESA